MTSRRGFSLAEIVVAVSITLVVFAITIPFVQSQTRALGKNAGRTDADQVARYAMRAVEQDLRAAAGEYGQPTIVAAGSMLLSFNANLRRGDSLDVAALEDEEIGTNSGSAWPLARAASLPTTSTVYPAADFVNADGDTSRAETVTYYLVADTSSEYADIYALYRQFNDQTATRLVTGLYLPSGQSFFSYYRDNAGTLEEISVDTMLLWSSTNIDELRVIGLRASGYYYNSIDSTEFVRTIETRFTLPVVLGDSASGCSSAPSAPSAGLAADTVQTPRGVTLSWTKVAEDSGTATSVLAYRLERGVGSVWSTIGVIAATGSGNSATSNKYQWTYPSTTTGSFSYRVSAIGCGGRYSTTASLGTVNR